MDGKSKIPRGELSRKIPEIQEHSYLPATSQDLITATLSPGEGVAVMELNGRIRRYLIQEEGEHNLSDGAKEKNIRSRYSEKNRRYLADYDN